MGRCCDSGVVFVWWFLDVPINWKLSSRGEPLMLCKRVSIAFLAGPCGALPQSRASALITYPREERASMFQSHGMNKQKRTKFSRLIPGDGNVQKSDCLTSLCPCSPVSHANLAWLSQLALPASAPSIAVAPCSTVNNNTPSIQHGYHQL